MSLATCEVRLVWASGGELTEARTKAKEYADVKQYKKLRAWQRQKRSHSDCCGVKPVLHSVSVLSLQSSWVFESSSMGALEEPPSQREPLLGAATNEEALGDRVKISC